jgi:hypothetical protein
MKCVLPQVVKGERRKEDKESGKVFWS